MISPPRTLTQNACPSPVAVAAIAFSTLHIFLCPDFQPARRHSLLQYLVTQLTQSMSSASSRRPPWHAHVAAIPPPTTERVPNQKVDDRPRRTTMAPGHVILTEHFPQMEITRRTFRPRRNTPILIHREHKSAPQSAPKWRTASTRASTEE